MLIVYLHSEKHEEETLVFQYTQNRQSVAGAELTFQSNDVTSLLLGTSWPPSRMQCLRTSCVELLLLFSLRFQIRAVESPDLRRVRVLNNTAFIDFSFLQMHQSRSFFPNIDTRTICCQFLFLMFIIKYILLLQITIYVTREPVNFLIVLWPFWSLKVQGNPRHI